jgi:hypothetical protein
MNVHNRQVQNRDGLNQGQLPVRLMRQRGVNEIIYTEEWANEMKLVIDGHFLASVLRNVYE